MFWVYIWRKSWNNVNLVMVKLDFLLAAIETRCVSWMHKPSLFPIIVLSESQEFLINRNSPFVINSLAQIEVRLVTFAVLKCVFFRKVQNGEGCRGYTESSQSLPCLIPLRLVTRYCFLPFLSSLFLGN